MVAVVAQDSRHLSLQIRVQLADIADKCLSTFRGRPLLEQGRWRFATVKRRNKVQRIVTLRTVIVQRRIRGAGIAGWTRAQRHRAFLVPLTLNVNELDPTNETPIVGKVPKISKYGLDWTCHPLDIERYCIRRGGKWTANGQTYGMGLFHHFKELEKILWPEEYHNRWTDWMLRCLVDNRISVFMACKDAGKTRRVSKWVLMDYWCFPNNTLTIMTSTTIRGLEMRVWGDIKSLWKRAHDKFDWLEGCPSDSKHGIFTDNITDNPFDDVKIRDMRVGIIGVPCMDSNEKFNGSALMEFAGIKQDHRRLIGDELAFMPVDYLKILDSLDAGDFKAAFCGNAIADNGMALDRVAEPEAGWGSEGEITKTTAWRNKYDGMTLNMVGIDSPNMDPTTLNAFPGMLTQDSINRVARRPGGKDSIEWWSQIMGVRKVGVVSDRPFTVADVKNNGGFTDVIWASNPSKGLAIDAGYGGDDCVKTYFEFGEEVNGRMVIAFREQSVYPVLLSSKETPEDQIAKAAKRDCDTLGIPYENVFIEAGMRATLAVSFGRVLSPSINAINFGGTATERPVSNDLFILDSKTQEKRLKRCNEHYSKFVTELIFNVRDLVLSGQARLFPLKAAEEFQRRKWRYVYGDRYEIESKIEYKERNGGKSPNESDSIMIAVEGALRLGFVIERVIEADKPAQLSIADINGKTVNLILPRSQPRDTKNWLENEVEKQRKFANEHSLSYDA